MWFGRRSPEYGFERCLIMFGYATGTAASGLLLLRIADPDYETPVAVEGGLMNVFSCLTFLPVTLSMPFAPLPGYPLGVRSGHHCDAHRHVSLEVHPQARVLIPHRKRIAHEGCGG